MTTIHTMSVRTSSKGFTLIEIMMVVAIIGLLAGLAIPKFLGYIEKARIARCIAEIRYFERDITAYYVSNEKYPDSFDDLGRSQNSLLDPWGNPYQYFLIAGTKWASNGGGGGKYYAHSSGTSGIVTTATGSEEGFWSGSWFVSEAWAAAGGGPPPDEQKKPRKDRFLKPITSDYDLYSMGVDGETTENLNAKQSLDDIIRASDGAYVGLAADF